MKPEVNKVLQKFSQETSDQTELSRLLVELAMDTDTLIKEIDNAADTISTNRRTAYSLASKLKSTWTEINSTFSDALKLNKELKQKVAKLDKVSQTMRDADLDDDTVQDELKRLERSEFRIAESIKQRNAILNDLKGLI